MASADARSKVGMVDANTSKEVEEEENRWRFLPRCGSSGGAANDDGDGDVDDENFKSTP